MNVYPRNVMYVIKICVRKFGFRNPILDFFFINFSQFKAQLPLNVVAYRVEMVLMNDLGDMYGREVKTVKIGKINND